MQYGHGPDWIYEGGPSGGPLRGSRSYYFNEYKTDPDFTPGKDVPEDDVMDNENMVANEKSLPDHFTSEPYTAASSYEVLTGPNAVDNILNFDDWLMDSNGVY